MEADETKFKAGWWSTDLGPYRDCASTYCLFPYEDLPPLDMSIFQGELGWLTGLENELWEIMAPLRPAPDEKAQTLANLDRLIAEAEGRNIALPEVFLRFMGSPELQAAIPSSTACFFSLPERIAPSPAGDDGHLIRFLCDQQGVLTWYLYLDPAGDHSVVVSPLWLYNTPDGATAEAIREEIWFCGRTLESFLYRFWLENRIWFALEEGWDFTPEEEAYLDHYDRE